MNIRDRLQDARQRWTFVLILVLVAPAVVGTSFLARCIAGARSGTVADWLEAIATLGALIGAVWAGAYAMQAVQIERQRDDRREKWDRRSQAALVAAWPPDGVTHEGGQVTLTIDANNQQRQTNEDVAIAPVEMQVNIRNASPLPITRFHLNLYVRSVGGIRGPWIYVGTHLQGSLDPESTVTHDLITPNFTVGVREVLHKYQDTRTTPPEVAVGWEFTDNAGLLWRRAPGEPLHELRTPSNLHVLSTRKPS